MTAQAGRMADAAQPPALGTRILELADSLAQWSETPRGLTCTYLTAAHRGVAGEIVRLMTSIGLETRTDAVGNVVGRYRSRSPAAKSVIVASHYDTVVNAGKYDGRLGIVTAIAVVERLAAAGAQLPFHLDIIAFSEEEGVRFSSAYIGSSAVVGRFDGVELQRRDAKGVTMEEAMRAAGFDPANIASDARRKEDVAAYLEVHIEQGPVLVESDLPVGVVTAIAGNSRFAVNIEGVAGHAGTVPMAYRHDAAAAAAEIVLCVEQRCSRTGLVGTVGRLSVPDGAPNVVPGRCDLTVDIRSGVDADRRAAVADVMADIVDIAKKRGVTIKATPLLDAAAVQCSPRLQDMFAASIERAGLPVFRLPSGAGHDAVMFDGFTEIGMLFVRCGNGGVSHSPLETVTASDCDYAARILMDILETVPLQ
jgi:beta-ureidopropionase / N-carbamoyl-L-amino-acid hydrolase